MTTKMMTAIILALFGTQAEYYTQEQCENLFFDTRAHSSDIVNACADAWGNMYDREYYPNY